MKTKAPRKKSEIGKWSHKHTFDQKYRTAQAEGSRRYQERLHRDAEFGRMARTILSEFGELFKKLSEVDDACKTI